MSVQIEQFETIQTLLERLQREKPEAKINLSSNVRFGLVTFKSESDQFAKYVLETEEWNYIEFFSYGPSTSRVKVIISILARLVETKHGSVPVLLDNKLIPLEKGNKVCIKNDKTALSFCHTSFNPHHHTEFKKQFDNVVSLLGEDVDCILCWLRKKIPKGCKIYVVGSTFYHKLADVVAELPIVAKYFGSLFKQDNENSQIYICKLNKSQLNILSGNANKTDLLQAVGSWFEIDPEHKTPKNVCLDDDEFLKRAQELMKPALDLSSGPEQIKALDELFTFFASHKLFLDLPRFSKVQSDTKLKLVEFSKSVKFPQAKTYYFQIFGETLQE